MFQHFLRISFSTLIWIEVFFIPFPALV
jgi:hypothetical protein